MKTAASCLILMILSFILPGTIGWLTKRSCDHQISLSCPEGSQVPLLHIMKINTTSSVAADLLEQCMARSHCQVLNWDNECIELTYWCHTVRERLEIKASSEVQLVTNLKDSTELSLMSHGYANGEYQDAQNIYCDIRELGDYGHCSSTLEFYVRDFAPFINYTGFCLILNSAEPPVCTGSRKFEIYRPRPHFYTRLGQHFNFTLIKGAPLVPQVRFWIAVNIKRHESPEKACVVMVKCDSKSVAVDATNASFDIAKDKFTTTNSPAAMKAESASYKNKLIPVFVFFCCLTILFAAGFAWAMVRNRRLSAQAASSSARANFDEDPLVSDDGHIGVQFSGS